MFCFQASKSRPAKEPIREETEEEETREADLEAGHEVAAVEEETDEATGRVPTEPSSLSESTTSRPVASKRFLLFQKLQNQLSWAELKDLMRKAGEVTYVDAHTRSGRGK